MWSNFLSHPTRYGRNFFQRITAYTPQRTLLYCNSERKAFQDLLNIYWKNILQHKTKRNGADKTVKNICNNSCDKHTIVSNEVKTNIKSPRLSFYTINVAILLRCIFCCYIIVCARFSLSLNAGRIFSISPRPSPFFVAIVSQLFFIVVNMSFAYCFAVSSSIP